MYCPKCGSDNVRMEAKKNTPKVFWPIVLTFGGFGMFFFGIPGFLIGGIVGVVVGLIVKMCLPTTYESIAVCQSCGHCRKTNS